MTTTKQRINISVSDQEADFLKMLAKRDGVPRATKTRQLVQAALELEEDFYLSKLAEERDKPGAQWIPHDVFWSDVLGSRPA